uniref:Uncharacterized protein n=1 Tax=Rhizophagus irregularis (strain DAOM 181602 / DAOM 197198 / MUCL 43194) TaxID=747089 RepID=U9T411_RHIID
MTSRLDFYLAYLPNESLLEYHKNSMPQWIAESCLSVLQTLRVLHTFGTYKEKPDRRLER